MKSIISIIALLIGAPVMAEVKSVSDAVLGEQLSRLTAVFPKPE